MMKSRLTIATLVIAGLAASPFAASAKMHKSKHPTSSSMNSSTTTGANMKSSGGNTSNPGNASSGMTNKNPAPAGKQ